jgi:hypothetical protein
MQQAASDYSSGGVPAGEYGILQLNNDNNDNYQIGNFEPL